MGQVITAKEFPILAKMFKSRPKWWQFWKRPPFRRNNIIDPRNNPLVPYQSRKRYL
jgi:hypothetical protein